MALSSAQPRLESDVDLAGVTPALVKQWSDPMWRLNHLYYIRDEHGEKVLFSTTGWDAAQDKFLREMWYLNVILKSRQRGFCLDPLTKVLTADLRWVPIGELCPCDEIVSVDEQATGGRGSTRKMRTGAVLAVVKVRRQAYRITFDDGRTVICTGKHPWLSRKVATDCDWRTIECDTKKKLTVGTKVRWITRPWANTTVEDGWFGGMLDGEGSISNGNRAGASINVCQRIGPVWDRLIDYCEARGYHHHIEVDAAERKSKFGKVPVPKVVFNRMDEIFRLIGQTRPTRFIGKRFWEGRELPGKRSGGVGWSKIVGIEPLGKRTMVDLQTTTGTYIAEGFVSHNTTAIDILALDTCLFRKNTAAGIIADNRENAEVIFDDKIKFAYDNLPDVLRERVVATNDNARELKFSNGSSIRVGTSMRSRTLQFLHVSEFGKISKNYPKKAREIVTGSFNTVHQGEMIFVESTAEGAAGPFFDLCKTAQDLQRLKRPLTKQSWKFHFYPWFDDPKTRLSDDETRMVPIPGRMSEYFDKMEKECRIKLDRNRRAWYTLKWQVMGDDMKREFPFTPKEAFEASIRGAYFADAFVKIRGAGRITKVPHTVGVLVDTWWDIGLSDMNAIWFTQTIGAQIRCIDYLEGAESGGLPYWVDELNKKRDDLGYRYGRYVGPHDIKVREWGTGLGRQTSARRLNIEFERCPPLVGAGERGGAIDIARRVLSTCIFDEERTEKGVLALENYRKEWNDKTETYKNSPLHDWASHGSSAFLVMAVMHDVRAGAQYFPMPGLPLPQEAPAMNAPARAVAGGPRRF